MATKETLWRITFHNKKTQYQMFLMIWGVDSMDALMKLSAVVGPNAEYELDSMSKQLDNGNPIERPLIV